MKRTFVLLLLATVLLACIFSADAATKTTSKSKSKAATKSKSKAATKTKKATKSKTVTKSKSKVATPPATPMAPTAAPTAPSSAPAVVGTNDFTATIKLDATASAANAAKDAIIAQLKTDLKAKNVTLLNFASGKFAVQDVASTATITDAVKTATEAKTLLGGSTYKLQGFTVRSVDVAASPTPSAARPLACVGVWAVLASVLLMAVTMF